MNIGHLMTARRDVLYLRSCAVSPPYVKIFQSSGSISFACASSRRMICVFSSTKLLLKAFCLLIMAIYLAGMKLVISTVRLSYEAHDPFLMLFNAAVEESNVIFAKVRHFLLVEAIL